MFYRYDEEHNADDKVFLDCFCKIAAGIKNNSNGHQLKDLILQKGITQSALDYMKKHIPSAKKYGHFYLTYQGYLMTGLSIALVLEDRQFEVTRWDLVLIENVTIFLHSAALLLMHIVLNFFYTALANLLSVLQFGCRCLEKVPCPTRPSLYPPTVAWSGHPASPHTGTYYSNILLLLTCLVRWRWISPFIFFCIL